MKISNDNGEDWGSELVEPVPTVSHCTVTYSSREHFTSPRSLTRFIMDSMMHHVWRRRRQKLSIQVMKCVKFQFGQKSFFTVQNKISE